MTDGRDFVLLMLNFENIKLGGNIFIRSDPLANRLNIHSLSQEFFGHQHSFFLFHPLIKTYSLDSALT